MRHLRAITIVILGIGLFASGILAVGHAVAQPVAPRTLPLPVAGVSRFFDTDWHQAPGRPSVLSGCVYNRYGALAAGVYVGVEGLDAKDAVVSSTTTWVGNVPAFSYGHFELPALAGASNYRIRVLTYDRSQAR